MKIIETFVKKKKGKFFKDFFFLKFYCFLKILLYFLNHNFIFFTFKYTLKKIVQFTEHRKWCWDFKIHKNKWIKIL